MSAGRGLHRRGRVRRRDRPLRADGCGVERVEEGGSQRGDALPDLLRLVVPAALLDALGTAQELAASTLRLIGAHRDLDVLLGKIVVVGRELQDLVQHPQRGVMVLAADRAFGELEIVDLRVAEQPLLRVQLAQRAVDGEVFLGDAEDLLADRDGVLVELGLGVFLDGLAVAPHGFLHGAALGKEIRDDDEVVRILVAPLEELLVLGEPAVYVALLEELLGLPPDRDASIYHPPSFPIAEESNLMPSRSADPLPPRRRHGAPARASRTGRSAPGTPVARSRANRSG